MTAGEAPAMEAGRSVRMLAGRPAAMEACGVPRFLLAAPASGSGKTAVTCGLLNLLKKRGMDCVSFKCGPDYIDPMFHRYVLGIPGCNLDSFFLGEDQVRRLFARRSAGARIAVIEGVMGYYDGIGGTDTRASSYDVARITGSPVVLVVDGSASSLSLAALVKGFAEYREDSRIRGVILNRTSAAMARRLEPFFEELGIRCFGSLPRCDEAKFDSRHLGLTVPEEQETLRGKLDLLSGLMEECLDVDGLLALAREAAEAEAEAQAEADGGGWLLQEAPAAAAQAAGRGLCTGKPPQAGRAGSVRRMGVALDEAFCFYYQENLDFLRDAGWEPVYFSPLHDRHLPENLSGLLLGGGYPELYGAQLAQNVAMRSDVRSFASGEGRILAECGGFLYLHRTLEGADGVRYPMAGVIEADGYRAKSRSRFGYISLTQRRVPERQGPERRTPGMRLKGHEFHYWDSTDPGTAMEAVKPAGGKRWDCMHRTDRMLAGFPHLYYLSDPEWMLGFLSGEADRP